MAWVEVYGGQRSLAFELTTEMLWVNLHLLWLLQNLKKGLSV